MVQWKGEVDESQAGGKAARLDRIESLNVPNFFVITREEVNELLGDVETPEEVLNKEIHESLEDQIEEAYKEIGMSSEVREASGKARNLVGGQRDTGRVSARISGERKGVYKSRLNVGSSDIVDAIKDVVASYYRVENEHEYPAVIVQKMVEPEYTGAAITSYLGGHGLLESVEGLGLSLEKGITTPDFYLLENGSVKTVRVAEEQVKVTRNPMNGNHQQRTVKKSEAPIPGDEVEQLFERLEQESVDAKFVYKRGSFYIVDAFESGTGANPFESGQPGLGGVRVSEGEIEGLIGQEVSFSEETVPPEKYSHALIAQKGGYTSTDAQLAREQNRPAIFSFHGELQQGQQVSIGAREVETAGSTRPQGGEIEPNDATRQLVESPEIGTEVLPINAGERGVYLSPPFPRNGYAVTDREVPGTRIPRKGYLNDYGRVFAFEGESAVIDARMLGREGLEGAMEYLDAELKALLLERPDREAVRAAVEYGFDVIAADSAYIGELEDLVRKEEKRFMLEKLREL
ncbi:MAG: PEP/pyruvate-binding domain-containing protein [Candidatus Nanohaloarchaea archaeon]